MSSPKKCPKCRLLNPPTAQRCDCGWDFVSESQEQTYLDRKHLPGGYTPPPDGSGDVVGILKVLGKVAGVSTDLP